MVGVDTQQALDDLDSNFIDTTEAIRRLEILETEPTKYNCGTCRFFRQVEFPDGECHAPGMPPRSEHALSVRCGGYQERDPRGEALPLEKPTGSRMWK